MLLKLQKLIKKAKLDSGSIDGSGERLQGHLNARLTLLFKIYIIHIIIIK